MPRSGRFLLLAGLLIGGVLLCAYLVKAHQLRPYGRYTAPQILARADALCRIVAPEKARLHLVATEEESFRHNSVCQHRWNVNCTDPAGEYVANFVWNADTGTLLRLGHAILPLSASDRRPLGRREAVRREGEWLRRLGIVAEGGEWRQREPPIQDARGWTFSWQVGKSCGVLKMDSSGDMLTYLSLLEAPSPL